MVFSRSRRSLDQLENRMKNLILALALVFGFSTVSMADDAAATAEHKDTAAVATGEHHKMTKEEKAAAKAAKKAEREAKHAAKKAMKHKKKAEKFAKKAKHMEEKAKGEEMKAAGEEHKTEEAHH